MLRPVERNGVHVGGVRLAARSRTHCADLVRTRSKTSNGALRQKLPSSTIDDHKGTIGTFAAICDF
jgi:hypothetical protein